MSERLKADTPIAEGWKAVGEPQPIRPSDGAIYAAVSQRDMTPEERAELDAAIEDIITDIRDMEEELLIANKIRRLVLGGGKPA
jgi:hypothetical protein